MRKLIVCRILSEIKPIEYKHIQTCMCPIYSCSQNNMRLQETNENIPYIKCSIEKQKSPYKFVLSHSCNCETKCKNNNKLFN